MAIVGDSFSLDGQRIVTEMSECQSNAGDLIWRSDSSRMMINLVQVSDSLEDPLCHGDSSMKLRIATYNVENLFRRVAILNLRDTDRTDLMLEKV